MMLHTTHTKWCIYTAALMFCVTSAAFISPRYVMGGIIQSSISQDKYKYNQDIKKIQSFLEKKIVKHKLIEYGVDPDLVAEKIRYMNGQDLHLIASMIERIPEGGEEYDIGAGFRKGQVIGLLVSLAIATIAIIVWVIIKIAKGDTKISSDPPNEQMEQ